MKKSSLTLIVESMRKNGISDTEILNALMDFSITMNELQILRMANIPCDAKVKQLLDEVCVSPNNKGYQLWVDAIELYIQSGKTLTIGEIYSQLAKKYQKTYCYISSAMNRSIKNAFAKCPKETVKIIFGGSVRFYESGAPANKEFLTRVANKI